MLEPPAGRRFPSIFHYFHCFLMCLHGFYAVFTPFFHGFSMVVPRISSVFHWFSSNFQWISCQLLPSSAAAVASRGSELERTVFSRMLDRTEVRSERFRPIFSL